MCVCVRCVNVWQPYCAVCCLRVFRKVLGWKSSEHPPAAAYHHAPSPPMPQGRGPCPQESGGKGWGHQAPPRDHTRTLAPAETHKLSLQDWSSISVLLLPAEALDIALWLVDWILAKITNNYGLCFCTFADCIHQRKLPSNYCKLEIRVVGLLPTPPSHTHTYTHTTHTHHTHTQTHRHTIRIDTHNHTHTSCFRRALASCCTLGVRREVPLRTRGLGQPHCIIALQNNEG